MRTKVATKNKFLISNITTKDECDMIRSSQRYFTKFIKENEGFVHKIVRHFNPPDDMDYDDYFQLGLMGLDKAIEKFDETQKVNLSTFAYHCIYNDILQFVNKQNKKRKREVSIENYVKRSENGDTSEYNEMLFNGITYDFEENVVGKMMIDNFMNSLEDLHKKIFICRVQEKMKHEDIAKKLNLNKHTYKYIWHYHVSPKVKAFAKEMRV